MSDLQRNENDSVALREYAKGMQKNSPISPFKEPYITPKRDLDDDSAARGCQIYAEKQPCLAH